MTSTERIERLLHRAAIKELMYSDTFEDGDPTYEEMCLIRALVRKIRQEHLDDEDDLVDEQWAEDIGLSDVGMRNERVMPIAATGLLLVAWPVEWPVAWRWAITNPARVVIRMDPTRGCVRGLYRALDLSFREDVLSKLPDAPTDNRG